MLWNLTFVSVYVLIWARFLAVDPSLEVIVLEVLEAPIVHVHVHLCVYIHMYCALCYTLSLCTSVLTR